MLLVYGPRKKDIPMKMDKLICVIDDLTHHYSIVRFLLCSLAGACALSRWRGPMQGAEDMDFIHNSSTLHGLVR